MKRKDYVAIAAALLTVRGHFDVPFNPNKLIQVCAFVDCAQAVADVCANDNPRFDRARFLKACGVQS